MNKVNATIFHQNISGLLSKKETLELCIQEFLDKRIVLDIICLSETFIKSNEEKNVFIKGYTLRASFSRKHQKRGGVCILCRNIIECKKIDFLEDWAIEFSFECCGIEIPQYMCIVICIYRIPKSNINIFFNLLENMLHKLYKRHQYKIIIAGDFNINTLKDTNDTRELVRILQNYNFQLHIKDPTRITSCIDHIASNMTNVKANVHELGLSDHNTGQTLSFQYESKSTPIEMWYIHRRDLCDENIRKFCEYMKSLSWSEVYNLPNLNHAFDAFHDTFTLFYNLCFPVIRVKKSNVEKRSSWITKGIQKAIVTKRHIRFIYYKTKKEQYKTLYHRYSKILKTCVKNAQKSANNLYLHRAKNKCRASWDLIQNKTSHTSTTNRIEQINLNGQIIQCKQEIAETFNDYFINVTNNEYDHKKYNLNNVTNPSTIFLYPCDVTEITNIVKMLRPTKSVGYDGISTMVLKRCIGEIAPVLTYLIDFSFSTGIFPDRLKKTIVKPLYKKNSKEDLNNYRPIALLPVLSKIFERAMHVRITKFCDKHGIIVKNQNGFQIGKSTSLAAFNLIKAIIDQVDKRKPVTAVFFDMSKAFDFVSHDRLLEKCEMYGIRGLALNWIKCYLCKRTQSVEVENINGKNIAYYSKSCFKEIKTGVPQGSVLGPLLFLLYINDLPLITRHECILFADDISLVIPCDVNTIELYNMDINNTINDMIMWMKINNLQPNLEKTKYVQFYNRNGSVDINLKYNDEQIAETDNILFLGILLDKNCSWKPQIDRICTKINRFVYVLRRLATLVNKSTALTAYHGYVASVLRYGLLLWGNSCDINRVFVSQKKCVRAICRLPPRTSCRPLFKDLGILTLPSLYIFETCKFTRLHPDLFIKLSSVCKFNVRDTEKLVLPVTYKTKLCSKNSYAMAIKLYNNLPIDIRRLALKPFISALHKWLIDKCFYTTQEFFNV
jgi:hypothetical protein